MAHRFNNGKIKNIKIKLVIIWMNILDMFMNHKHIYLNNTKINNILNISVKCPNGWGVADSLGKLAGKFCADLRTFKRSVEQFRCLKKVGETVFWIQLPESLLMGLPMSRMRTMISLWAILISARMFQLPRGSEVWPDDWLKALHYSASCRFGQAELADADPC